jgi:hypothetical protein
MRKRPNSQLLAMGTLVAALLGGGPAYAELSATELAKIAQNPVGNLTKPRRPSTSTHHEFMLPIRVRARPTTPIVARA